MERIKKIQLYSGIILGSIIFLLVITNSNIPFNAPIRLDHLYEDKPSIEDLKISKISEKIFINGSSDWVDLKNAGNCTGQGTFSDPYVIEDLVIDGDYVGSCIRIENSNEYFRIENCTMFNARNYGIYLYNVTNGYLFNNTCSFNFAEGIRLDLSHNNTISEITLNNNADGIHLYESSDNTISGNRVAYNNYAGIRINISNNTKVNGNKIEQNRIGIELWMSNNSFVLGNILNECGLRLFGNINSFTSNKIDPTNLVNSKPLYYYANEVGLNSNNFTNGGQVILFNCNNSLISDLDVSDSTRGISLYYCNKNNISGNIANNNLYGISLEYCNNVTISGNSANDNFWNGIDLVGSNYNIVSENRVDRNSVGIGLWKSNHTLVSRNTGSNNLYYGIWLDRSNNNTISDNIANSNSIGILLDRSKYNEVIGNTLTGNAECINEFDCEGNVIKNNDCGEEPVINGYEILYLLSTVCIVSMILLKKTNRTKIEIKSNAKL